MTRRTAEIVFGSVLCLIPLSGCRNIDINPPNPAGPPGPAPATSTASVLTIPVTVKVADVQSLVNTQAPTHLEGTDHITINVPHVHFCGMLCKPKVTHDPVEVAHVDWHADRSQIVLHGSSDTISVHTSFSGGGKLIPSSATADASGTADGSSTLMISPDYNIAPSVNLNVSIDHAAVLHDISVKGLVQGAVNDAINKYKGALGPAISQRVDLRKHAQTAWAGLPGVMKIPGTSDIWLTIDPQAMMLVGPHAVNDTVTATLALKANLTTLYQQNQPTVPHRIALPNLTGGPADDRFHISLPVEIDYAEVNSSLAQLIADHKQSTISLPDNQVALLKSASVLPLGNRLYLKIGFVGESGKWISHVKGTIIFVAQPLLSADKTTLSFTNLDYTAETASTLKGLGVEAVATLGKPIIVPILERKLVLHFGPYLDKAKSEAGDAAGKLKLPPPLSFQLQLENLVPNDLAVYGDRLFLNFDASGHASVTF